MAMVAASNMPSFAALERGAVVSVMLIPLPDKS
jgi:hypothetical protein